MSNSEIIKLLIHNLYNDGDYQRVHLKEFLEQLKLDMHQRDFKILYDEIRGTGMVEFVFDPGGPVLTDIAYLSDEGIKIIKKYKSYYNYLEFKAGENRQIQLQKAKEERAKKLESWPKRNWFWVAIIGYFAGIVSTPIQKLIESKILPDKKELVQPIPTLKDTSRKDSAESVQHPHK
jgi:hypothetical protein